MFRAALAAIAVGAAIVWLALLGRDPRAAAAGRRPSVFLSLALVSPLPVFVGVGALASQIAPTRRMAHGARAARCSPLALLLRVVADTSSAGWLRWATPLGLGRGAAAVHRRRGRRC